MAPAPRPPAWLAWESPPSSKGDRHGNGQLERALLGSVSSGLVHHAHCPLSGYQERYPDVTVHKVVLADRPTLGY